MRAVFSSLISAAIGGLVVFYAMSNFAPPAAKTATQIVRTNVGSVDSSPAEAGALTPQAIYERYSGAVVHVQATVTSSYNGFFGMPVPQNQVSTGSGFIVSSGGYVVTNAHVVQDAQNIKVQLADKVEIPAKLVGVDQSTDLAFLKVDFSGHDFKVLKLGSSQSVKVGQPVYAIGNPLGLDRSMSGGLVSALNRAITAPNGFPIRSVIQTDAAINPGNSGGPLLSSKGEVIGVTAQIASEGSSGNIGIAFAIPSDTVKKVFTEIKQSGKASHAWIGIQGATLFPQLAQSLKVSVKEGAIVIAVLRPGPAETAGLKGADHTIKVGQTSYDVGGDIIAKLGNVKISSMDDLIAEVNRFRVGDEVKLTIVGADNKSRQVTVKLEERPQQPPSPPSQPQMP
ncbi:MAG: trypsin-like peptidase domain-containing protein [Actinomycetota bacterium]|nr:trypsin-like peptidase domain-containing protein [Actinomycetota bacterium]